MKKISILILSIFLMGCSKKTHLLVSTDLLKQTKSVTDSIGQTKNATIDKSIIFTSRDVDTTVTVSANTLTGSVNFNNSADSLTNTRFYNDDFNLYIQTNKKTGVVKATVLPKAKKVNIKIHEQTTIHNNIEHTLTERSKSSSKLETKTDSVNRSVTDHTEPAVVFSFKKNIIWFIVAVILIGVIYYLAKNASIINLFKGWLKRIL